MTLRETHGPDQCKGNLNALTLHQGGDPSAEGLGYLTNCVCCDPCHTVRPISPTGAGSTGDFPSIYCCRCVPRGIYARFVPDDPDDECCVEYAEPMLLGWDGALAFYATYLFGVAIEVTLGRVGDACEWNMTATDSETGYEIDSQTVTVDNEEVTCWEVPTDFEIAVDGPLSCTGGTLVLANYANVKLPFVERYEPEYPDWEKFVDLTYNPCGDCVQVCRKLCLDGVRHVGDVDERVEFVWFEDYDGTRGWSYQEPDSEFVERILLEENEYGGCQLVFDLEAGADHFDDLPLELCSCGLEEQVMAIVGGSAIGFWLRCGRCSCWDFYCGSCRCVPEELCVLLVIGTDAERLILTWDPDEKRWGSDYDPLRLNLGADGDDCLVTADVTGYGAIDDDASFNCRPAESVTNVFNPERDFLGFELTDSTRQIYIVASGLSPECALGACSDATPCNADCGGHPAQLTVNIRLWREVGDISDPYDAGEECSFDVVIHYWETLSYEAGTGVLHHCGYTGWADLPNAGEGNCVHDHIRVDLYTGLVTITSFPGITPPAQYGLNSEECNPYLGHYLHPYSFGTPITPGFSQECIGCSNVGTTRLEITITE